MEPTPNLPDSNSTTLILSHPTPEECTTIWTSTSSSWKDALPTSTYLRESLHLTTVPLAKNDGLTLWILVDRSQSPNANQRTIICSCETFRKRSLVSDASGRVRDVFVHGVASVFCAEKYRGRGYAGRMMRELKATLRNWQEDICGIRKCVGSVLYSDIGKEYYARFGWRPTPTNSHLVFKPVESVDRWWQEPETCISKEDLPALCWKDEVMIRKAMSVPVEGDGAQERFSIVPDVNHMLWHMSREEFTCNILFGKIPEVKGAIAGPEGRRVWVIWTHRYYSDPADGKGDNTLYILRIVFERDDEESIEPTNALEHCGIYWPDSLQRQNIRRHQLMYLETVLSAAQNEAAEWKLDQVKLWHPTPEVTRIVNMLEIGHAVEEREEDSIASVLWFDRNGGEGPPPLWINNEHYAWC
ncbi:lysine acetyltransferase protein [Rutstroemia sp. NJR-2017a BVV2]|nr:lysine acetyltransferase protein [Rutstroemia sp. NJR-2017a BVV2]